MNPTTPTPTPPPAGGTKQEHTPTMTTAAKLIAVLRNETMPRPGHSDPGAVEDAWASLIDEIDSSEVTLDTLYFTRQERDTAESKLAALAESERRLREALERQTDKVERALYSGEFNTEDRHELAAEASSARAALSARTP
jgi:hypothetical protein